MTDTYTPARGPGRFRAVARKMLSTDDFGIRPSGEVHAMADRRELP